MKILLIAVCSLISICAVSQGGAPSVKQGTKMSYDIVSTDQNKMSLDIKVDSITPSYIKYTWSSSGVGKGVWIVKQKSLESANSGRWSQLQPDADETLPDDQLAGLISKTQWASVQKDKKLQLDMVNYTVKKSNTPSKINDKEVDAIYLESETGGSKIWILNNASYPAVIKITGNSAGPDIELKTLTN